jgi:pSer/pThr/pTyr-binding forkhead associated (FHA) protein
MPDRLAPSSSGSQGGPSRPGLALRFISGKYQGGEFPLEEGQRIVIGRSSDLDMVLVEEMVSRRHAQIQMHNGVISIEDLGSTNGTFVNGEKIQRGTLREGDRVLIGTSILKVVSVGGGGPESRRDLERMAVRRVTARQRNTRTEEAPRMTGNLEEIPLPDLLQLFGTSRKNGVLVIRTDSRIGRIFLDKGLIHFALIEGQPELPPVKAVYRMLEWRRGLFELDPPSTQAFDHPVDLSVQEVLMEGFRQQDELAQLRERLPPPESRMMLKTPLEAPLHELEPTHLDLLQTALNCPSLDAVFDRSPHTDLETAKILVNLMQRGYLMAAPTR